MSHKFLLNSSFHELLFQIDFELAKKAQNEGCPYCGGKLHQADYPRSPLGLAPALREHYEKRCSLCCAQCRRRTTPPSVRFFGRYLFAAPLLVLISALQLGPTMHRCAAIQRHFGITVSKRTWKRWCVWWQNCFAKTAFWKQAKGLVPIEANNGPFPRTLLDMQSDQLTERLPWLLRFFAPMTAGALRAV